MRIFHIWCYLKIRFHTFWGNLTNVGRPTNKDLYVLLKFVRRVDRSIPEVWPHNFKSDRVVAKSAYELNAYIYETLNQLSDYSARKFYYICNKECLKECKEEKLLERKLKSRR